MTPFDRMLTQATDDKTIVIVCENDIMTPCRCQIENVTHTHRYRQFPAGSASGSREWAEMVSVARIAD